MESEGAVPDAPVASAFISKPLLDLYCFYGTIIALKLATMFVLTIKARMQYKVFPNEEDAAKYQGGDRDLLIL